MAGVPTARRKEICARVVELISEGVGVTFAANRAGADRKTIWRWRQQDAQFDEEYRKAYLFTVENGIGEAKRALEAAEGRDEILKHGKLLSHAEWEAEKLLKHYQPIQKMEVEHSGPMVIGWDDNQVCPKCGHNMSDVSEVTIVENDDAEGLQVGIPQLPQQADAEEAEGGT